MNCLQNFFSFRKQSYLVQILFKRMNKCKSTSGQTQIHHICAYNSKKKPIFNFLLRSSLFSVKASSRRDLTQPFSNTTTEMKDYRLISCCNVIYKVISKIIVNRLRGSLPRCISYNQSAFIKDRLLVENLLLATEIVKDYHKEDISPRCAMKIDIAKAFDSVHWPFLLNTLRALNIPEEFVHWVELCVCTASFSV